MPAGGTPPDPYAPDPLEDPVAYLVWYHTRNQELLGDAEALKEHLTKQDPTIELLRAQAEL